jgi:glycosyltransferase involved in cell wall biosynthesis
MKIALVTDAWSPQVNGVVTTLVELVRELSAAGHELLVIEPGQFRTRPCPGYAGIDLAISPRRQLTERLDAFTPDAIHLATEGPLGWAGRRYCLRRGLAFTTAFHTKFPEILNAAARVPVSWGYALFRHFHRPSSGVMVPTQSVLAMLDARGFRNLCRWTHGVDTDLFRYVPHPVPDGRLDDLPRPIALFVGRVSYEKNIQAFLQSTLPGSKVVCGVGPVEAQLKARHPEVRWIGLLSRPELARLYAAADVFVFPRPRPQHPRLQRAGARLGQRPTCRCWSGCGFSASCRPTSTSSSRCASAPHLTAAQAGDLKGLYTVASFEALSAAAHNWWSSSTRSTTTN